MVAPLRIGARLVGPDQPCFVIAEAGINHNGSVDLALKLVDAARGAEADAVKFQLFRVEEQVSAGAMTAEYQQRGTGATNMREMARRYDLPWEAHRIIVEHCRRVGITYMLSCFDPAAVDFALELGCECIKVGSGEITNYPLLAHIARTGVPILLSTGMSTLEEVAGAVDHIRESGGEALALFHCVSSYPTHPGAVNLRAMQTLERAFRVPVGFSDHTVGSEVAVAAVALGACIVEKHFTTDKMLPGPDHAMSLDAREFSDFVAAIRNSEAALGDGRKQPSVDEFATRIAARRSLVSVRAIKAGERLGEDMVTLKRPATGIDPRLWHTVRGRVAAMDIPGDVPITWEMLQ